MAKGWNTPFSPIDAKSTSPGRVLVKTVVDGGDKGGGAGLSFISGWRRLAEEKREWIDAFLLELL